MGLDQPAEGGLVTAPGGVEQVALGHAAPSRRRALGCQKAISPPAGVVDDAAPARRALARREQDRGTEPARALGDLVDALDLDVGQPHRAPRGALDDPAAEGAAQPERVIGAGSRRRSAPCPSQELGVERARARPVAGVQLQMHDGMARGRLMAIERADLAQLRDHRPFLATIADALLEARERLHLRQRVAPVLAVERGEVGEADAVVQRERRVVQPGGLGARAARRRRRGRAPRSRPPDRA